MNESQSTSKQKSTKQINSGFYIKFISGEFGLAKTYWLFGVLPNFIANIALRTVASDDLAYWIGVTFLVYLCVLLVALWNAGRKYTGSKIWPVLAFLVVLLGVLRSIGPVLDMGAS